MVKKMSWFGGKGGPLPLSSSVLSLVSCSELSFTCLPVSVPLQVTIEVVEEPQAQVEMDLLAEPGHHWPQGASSWLPVKELFWPLFWGIPEGKEGNTDLKGRAPGDEDKEEEEKEEEEKKDYLAEFGESEDQEASDYEEYDEEESGFSGATGSQEQGWLAPGDWAFKEPDGDGEHPHLGIPSCGFWRS